MADIRPFAAVRPADNEKAKEIAALPYDVVSRSEAKAEIGRNPLSFLRIDRAETSFSDEVKESDPKVYERASELLSEMKRDGNYISDEKRCYYIYELTMDGRVQTGIAAVSSVDDYLNGVIKKHENTRAEKELDRINHVDICSAQTGPIFLAYRKNAVIEEVTNRVKADPGKCLYDFVSDDGIRHRVFSVSDDNEIKAVSDAFSSTPSIYIADGHHRAASAVKVALKRREAKPDYDGTEEFNFFLSVLFPDSELKILDYNRVVKDLNGRSEEEFLGALKERCELMSSGTSYEYPPEKHCFSVYLPGNDAVSGAWYVFCFRDEDIEKVSNDPVKSLDVSLLQDIVLSPLLSIGDPRTDPRIDFVGGIRGYEELEKRCGTDCSCAFAMYPTGMDELFAVADAGLLMPPKSTWFEPKLRSGIFVHEIERQAILS